MYVLVRAIGVKKVQGSRYESINVNAVPVNELFNIYRKAYYFIVQFNGHYLSLNKVWVSIFF